MSGPASANDPAALRAVLAENLAELTALLDGVSGADLDVRLGDGEWSVREIVLHLLHAERWLLPQLTELRRAVAPGLPLPPPTSSRCRHLRSARRKTSCAGPCAPSAPRRRPCSTA